jgi:hypothetical protein
MRAPSRVRAVLAALAVVAALAAGAAPAPSPDGQIAYVRALPGGTTEFHVVRPDGTGDRTILKLPIDGRVFTPELAWSPDGAELGFVSDHEAARSFYDSDVYAVRPDGSGLRRVTNSPDQAALGAYPKGRVTVDVRLPPGQAGGPFLVYVEGAAAPQAVTGSRRLTFENVAVFRGRAQFAIVINGLFRWFNAGVGAPLRAGATTDLGTLSVSGEGLREVGAYDLSWRRDGKALLYRFGECCLYRIAARPGDKDTGQKLLETSGYASWVEYAPVAARAPEFLYADWDVLSGTRVMLASESNPKGRAVLEPDSSVRVRSLKWLPDGSGFVYTRDVLDEFGLTAVGSDVFAFDFATRASRRVTRLEGAYAIRVSVSPDGRRVAFEHSPDGKDLDGLWVVNLDGSGLRALVKGAGVARPAWGPAATAR